MTDAAALFTAKTPPGLFAAQAPSPYAALGSTEGNGTISGGLLRPGSIDQTTFLQMLQQQQQNRQAAGVGGKPVAMPIQSFQPAIPTLTSAQFAALVGMQNADPGLAGGPAEGMAADPQAMAALQIQAQPQAQAQAAAPMVPSLKLSGAASRTALPKAPVAGNITGAAQSGDDMPTISRKSTPVLEASAEASPQDKPAEDESKTASKADPDVIHLKSPPDKEQLTELRMRNKRWVVDETPGARQLFFGADGEFGWDDFLDLINPLQHIPGVAQIYRAITGDQINGAASLLGAIPFGPFGGLSLLASVADLAVKDTTGEDIGSNLQAMIFGRDEKSAPGTTVPADMADADPAAPATATVQTASRSYAASDASQMHEDCRG